LARLQHTLEHVAVDWISPVLKGYVHALAQLVAMGKGHDREIVRIFGRQSDRAFVVRLMLQDVIGGQAIELRGRRRDGAMIVVDVALEGGYLLGQFIVQLLEARAGRGIFIDTGESEGKQLTLEIVARGRVRARYVQGD
jgi:hypothetical protein